MMSTLRHWRAILREELPPTLRLAVPIVAAEIGWMSMSLVDNVMVGRLPNSAVAIGAVGLASGLYYLTAIFGGGLLLGLDTLASQAFGARNLRSANRALFHALYLAGMLVPILMGIVLLWPPLMERFGVAPEIAAAMRPFLHALNWGTPPLLLYFALRRYLQAVHIVKPVAFALITANIINFVFNWMFIYGHLGVPAMGIAGSGWSTCLARLYMAGVLVFAIVRHNLHGELHIGTTSRTFDLRIVKEMLWLGLPAATQILLEIGVFSAATALCAKFGATAAAAHVIALNCAAFTYMVPLGISSAAAVRVGNGVGRGDPGGATRAGWTAILVGAAFMTCAGVLFVSIPQPIARIFSPDPQVIRMGVRLLAVAAAFQLFDGLQTVATGALRGAGETRIPMLANLVAYWVIGLPIGILLGFRWHWGPYGIWIGLTIGLVLIALTLVWYWRHTMHARIPVHESAAAS